MHSGVFAVNLPIQAESACIRFLNINRKRNIFMLIRFFVHGFPVCFALLLSGCALLQPSPVSVARPDQSAAKSFALNGRLSIDHQGRQHSAGLRWTHRVDSDEILMFAPLGKTVARVYRDAESATLDDGDGHYQARNAESLMEQVLGWHLPLDGLHQWVLGMQDNDRAAQVERDDAGRISVLNQSGWEINYLQYSGEAADSLPSRMLLNHEDLKIRLLIDEWEWNLQ